MHRFKSWSPPPDEHTRYGSRAFDSSLGSTVPVTAGGDLVGHGTVVGYEVTEDPHGVALTIEVDAATWELLR